MKDILSASFWTAEKRSWVYKTAVAAVPLLVSIGIVTGDTAQLVLNVLAAVLGVGASGMALSNITPDTILTVGLKIDDEEE